jgi:hypothetical protein
MNESDTPAKVGSMEQLGLVERLRTDVLWHRRRFNETIALDCQEAADEVERLRAELLCAQECAKRWQGVAETARELVNLSDSRKQRASKIDP